MSSAILKRRVDPAEFREQLKEAVETVRHTLAVLEQLSGGLGETVAEAIQPKDEPLPDLAKVKVIANKGVAGKVRGRTGVVLGRSLGTKGEWLYTVLIDSVQETYMLTRDSLQHSGDVALSDDVYGTGSITVRVDATGAGQVVRARRRKERRR